MKSTAIHVIECESGRVVVSHIEVARSLWKQAIGLLGRAELTEDSGLWIEPCNSVHTFGMRFPIDALFLDGNGRVTHRVENLVPWRIAGPIRGAKVVVELPAGTIKRRDIRINMRLVLK